MNSRLFYSAIIGSFMLAGACTEDDHGANAMDGDGDGDGDGDANGGAGGESGPGAESCGDGACGEDEDCEECAEDCGECAVITCEEGDCMFEACNGDYLHLYFAEDILSQPACTGATLPTWFSEGRCFIKDYEWGLLADPANECKFLYAHCVCDDGEYRWAKLAGQLMGVLLTDPAAVAAAPLFTCGAVDEYCVRKEND